MAVPTLSMPMSAHEATVRASAIWSVCEFMSETRSASDACCHAPMKPRSITRDGRHRTPEGKGPLLLYCTQWPANPVAKTGGTATMPWPMIMGAHPGTFSSPCPSMFEPYTELAASPMLARRFALSSRLLR